MRRILLLTLVLIMPNPVYSEDIDLTQMSWLEGCWQGEGLGGQMDECWISAPDGRLTGLFQLVTEGQQSFSEIMMLSYFDGVPGLRVKHFDPAAFTQWSSDNGVGHTFKLLNVGTDFVTFDGLEYRLEEGKLKVRLQLGSADGSSTWHEMTLTRRQTMIP